MIDLYSSPVVWKNGRYEPTDPAALAAGREKTIAYRILRKHDSGSGNQMRIRFDSLISHDITYVGIIQTARASGLKEFPVPYVLTNCHNSLCAVGGTINEDDHVFGLSAARKYGGNYVPANQAVIHQYAREMMSGCGRMILGSDSHTRYGALGTMGVGEGGPELVKQLLQNTYDITSPEVVLVYLTGKPGHGVGPQDVAIALCGAVYKNGFVKNKVLEFAGPGVAALPMDYRIGIDVMTTETACLSSIWTTDERVQQYLTVHGRPETYACLTPEEGACYDSAITIDLSIIEPMVAVPFHPSEAFTIAELKQNAADILHAVEQRAHEQFGEQISLHLTDKLVNGKLMIDQGVIAGCSGGMYDNIAEAAAILSSGSIGCGNFSLSVYPSSIPVNLRLIRSGIQESLLQSGALFKPCFCGPCFGAGDVPANNGLSIRHTTRNFPNREGSKPQNGQLSAVMLMDARSIAATALHHGELTSAAEIDYTPAAETPDVFDAAVYEKRCYFGYGKPQPQEELKFGPNITDWPQIPAMPKHLLMKLCAVIHDPVTTTDELIPSGETSSYRSNPMKLATFALSRREPQYVARTEAVRKLDEARLQGCDELHTIAQKLGLSEDIWQDTGIGSVIYATRPGDGSAREQAASCQRVLGGSANICRAFATKRYRSNCINWGMMPFTLDEGVDFPCENGDFIWVPNILEQLKSGANDFAATALPADGSLLPFTLHIGTITDEEREILIQGCLMNYYAYQSSVRRKS